MSGWSISTFILLRIKIFVYFIESKSRDLLVGVKGLLRIYNECQITQVLWTLCGTFVRVYITSWLFFKHFKENAGGSRVAWSLCPRKWLHEWLIHCRIKSYQIAWVAYPLPLSNHNYILWNVRWAAYLVPPNDSLI